MSGGLQGGNLTRQQLNGAAPRLVRNLRGQYKDAAKDAAKKAEQAILESSSKHPGTLRKEIAATVTTSIRLRGDGLIAEISSRGTLMPPGKQSLPAYADGETPRYTRWRHPVFGRIHEPWKTMDWLSARGWFTGTLQGEKNRFAAAAQKAMDDIAAELNR